MIRAKVEKAEWPYHYDIDDMKNVRFEQCTLGGYKGKDFIIMGDGNVREFKVVAKEMGGLSHSVIIPTEIEYSEDVLTFHKVFFDAPRKVKFAIEDGTVFEGYTYNRYWNGWLEVYGTKETVELVAKEFELKDVRYDKNKDEYVYTDEDWEQEDVFGFNAIDANTEDGLKHLYEIGNGWIWSEVEEDESDEDT